MAGKKAGRAAQSSAREDRTRWMVIALGIVLVLALGLGGLTMFRSDSSGPAQPAATPPQTNGPNRPAADSNRARPIDFEVVAAYEHDRSAFTQGLLWYEGGFYESTGLEGQSSLRRVEFPSGKVTKMLRMPPDIFAEGLALVGDRLIQLTWKTKKGFVYDRETFKLLREFTYDTEGWGLTYDGKHLIMSDGSDQLIFMDPESFAVVRKLPVRMNGRPLRDINELEYIEGEVWANVWMHDFIVRIDPATGIVKSYLNLRGLLEPTGGEDVLNGIAYDPATQRIFVTGKLWPKLFEIRVKE